MKKFNTALKLFGSKVPFTAVKSIERNLTNWFMVTTDNGDTYSVDIGANTVEQTWPDPEY